jgi:hypothetical protein
VAAAWQSANVMGDAGRRELNVSGLRYPIDDAEQITQRTIATRSIHRDMYASRLRCELLMTSRDIEAKGQEAWRPETVQGRG